MRFVFLLFNVFYVNIVFVKCIIWWPFPTPKPAQTNNNVILIPGYMGNQLNFKDDSKILQLLNFECINLSLTTWNTLWFDPYKVIACQNYWQHIASLNYNKDTKVSDGVPAIGELNSMRYISPLPYHLTDTLYYNKLIECLKKPEKGYVEGKDLFGAARDWRKGPNELKQHFVDLKSLVETSFNENNKKIILVGHSMGGIIGYIFLVRQTTEWKNKYIRSLVTVGSRLGGGFKNVYGFLLDDDPPADKYKVVRKTERTWTGYTTLMPTLNTWNTTVFIQTPSKNYTIADFKHFFDKINYPIGYNMYIDSIVADIDTFPHPKTSVYCMGGLGQQTPLKLIYADDDFKTAPTKVYGDGDTFVNREALEKCLLWKDKGYEFSYKTFNTDHLGLIRNDEPINFVCNAVASMSK